MTQRDAEQVAWLLGVLFTVQIVPGAGDSVLHVLAGRLESVLKHARQLAHQAWSFDVPQRADLVVAAIEGDVVQQTWDNVGRAVAAAQRVVNDNGVIALCTEVSDPPGPGMCVAAESDNIDLTRRLLNKQKTRDISAAEQWAQALDEGRIYLLSRLDPEQTEQLGAAHVTSAEEISRLIHRSNSCILLSNAQRVLPTTANR